ncbi:unnamed protein product [Hymenolepis diminuta]|uniref:2-(3-amino-3-carboxypropyl)histidine synthase subunit 1 n=1 Tax=Hymenolepis diminuta TaxID=6216 RepID=A0A0R3SQ04_HYMDI|nr:unnamed protein product [Hymenolepis diminuta]VUZ52424.1 unnamed protein product [Hymenolepis diminuta]
MSPKRVNPHRIPDEVLNDPELNTVIEKGLPNNYNFEVHKTIWRIRFLKAKRVALQMPEGLLRFATILSEIFKHFGSKNYNFNEKSVNKENNDFNSEIDIIVMGDVTYGACCVDDFSAKAMGVDLLVHYGHSCLIPIEDISFMYVFVDIKFDVGHFIDSAKNVFPHNSTFALFSTIQFVSSLPTIKQSLEDCMFKVIVPQRMPLSPGELLGCTSPKVSGVDFMVFIGDGRFHLESAMLANPTLTAYMYDPYNKAFTVELYDHPRMRSIRKQAIERAKSAKCFGVILGTLGRQGSPPVVEVLLKRMDELGIKSYIILLSEIFPDKLKLFGDKIDAWVQVACPRLSIDWGVEFQKPLLTPYEAAVALGMTPGGWSDDNPYPTDYYAYDSLGPWTPNHAGNVFNKSIATSKTTCKKTNPNDCCGKQQC